MFEWLRDEDESDPTEALIRGEWLQVESDSWCLFDDHCEFTTPDGSGNGSWRMAVPLSELQGVRWWRQGPTIREMLEGYEGPKWTPQP